MNRFNWTYVDTAGIPHTVGVMHGAESGNLMIYCDSNIIHIRFKIFESTSLSFFIEEELCELQIEKQGNNYLYGFTIDKDADTPLNRRRKVIDRKHFKQTLAVASFFFVFMAAFTAGILLHNKQEDMTAMRRSETNAKVFLMSNDDSHKFTYQFIANGKPHKIEKQIESVDQLISENGMPLVDGDEFTVRYTKNNPTKNQIDYNRPSPKQIIKYHDRALEKYQSIHKNQSLNYCACMIDQAYDLKGIAGLASMYFQDTDISENNRHNRNSYQKLVNDPVFQQKIKSKCDK